MTNIANATPAAATKLSAADKYNALIALATGRTVTRTKDGSTASFAITGAHNNQRGKMNADTEVAYLVLTNKQDGTEVALHPNDAKKLFAGNTVKEYKLEGDAVKLPKPVKATPAPAAKEPKEPSKRELCAVIFADLRAANKARKEVIAAMMSAHQMSMQGAATYYQAFKSGKWAVPAVAPAAAVTEVVAAEAVADQAAA